MPKYNILGVSVDFPYDAYQCQLIYMERVITSLQSLKNALLESPTGTGKTLCLLCATLAWRENERQRLIAQELDGGIIMDPSEIDSAAPSTRSRLPQIIYASRTHSQLSQVVHELGKTVYKPSLKMCILGSRNQLCVHPTVKAQRGSDINRMCRQKVQSKTCEYHAAVQDMKSEFPQVEDIEEFRQWGFENKICPYFLSKEQKAEADIIFMPYNYVLDPLIRKSLSLDLDGAIVILDEAHNVESVAADCGSFELTTLDLQGCIEELTRCLDIFGTPAPPDPGFPNFAALVDGMNTTNSSNNNTTDPNAEQQPQVGQIWTFSSLRDTLSKLKTNIENIQLFPDGFTQPGDFIFSLMANVGITPQSAPSVLQLVDNTADLLANDQSLVRSFKSSSSLSQFSEALRKLFADEGSAAGSSVETVAQHYRVHIQEEQQQSWRQRNNPAAEFFGAKRALRRVSFWCFNAGITMRSLAKCGIRNFILTSGTLSPLDSFAYELSLDFPAQCRLENPHVVDPTQIWVGAVSKAANNAELNSSYQTRSTEYLKGVGSTVMNICRIVPDGVLVFFPSYSLMEQCINAWRETDSGSSIWDSICKYKQPVMEPRESSKLQLAIDDYVNKIKSASMPDNGTKGPLSTQKGAVFFAVCRGKVSEGLDFADENGRAVVIVGLPFPNTTDKKIELKRKYLDDMKIRLANNAKSGNNSTAVVGISGSDWYNQSAWRAINQAVGRVIRHRFDYGAIFLADVRFLTSAERHLSRWLRPQVKPFTDPHWITSLTGFFKNLNANPPSRVAKPKMIQLPNGTNSTVDSAPFKSAIESYQQANLQAGSSKHLIHAIDRAVAVEEQKKAAKNAPAAVSNKKTPSDAEKQEAMQRRSKQYLATARKQLNAEEYDRFKEMMRSYRAKSVTVQEIMETHLAICGTAPDRDELRQNFTTFLPAEHRKLWLERVKLLMSGKPSNAPQVAVSPKPQQQQAPAAAEFKHHSAIAARDVKHRETFKRRAVPVLELSDDESDGNKPSSDDIDLFAPASSLKGPVVGFSKATSFQPAVAITKMDAEEDAVDHRRAGNVEPPNAVFDENDDEIMFVSAKSASVEPPSLFRPARPLAPAAPAPAVISPAPPVAIPPESPSDWVKSIRRKRGPPTTEKPSSATGPGPLDNDRDNILFEEEDQQGSDDIFENLTDVSPEPPLKKMKRANSIDLVTGKETDRPPMGLFSPISAAQRQNLAGFVRASSTDDLGANNTETTATPPGAAGGHECPICRSSTGEMYESKCKHVCCYDCWQKMLAIKLECPVCRNRVRDKQLTKVECK